MTLDEVYDAIGQFPEGLTSKQIADFLGKSANQVSGLASKLFRYGKVGREFAPGYRGIYRYKPKKEVRDGFEDRHWCQGSLSSKDVMTKKKRKS